MNLNQVQVDKYIRSLNTILYTFSDILLRIHIKNLHTMKYVMCNKVETTTSSWFITHTHTNHTISPAITTWIIDFWIFLSKWNLFECIYKIILNNPFERNVIVNFWFSKDFIFVHYMDACICISSTQNSLEFWDLTKSSSALISTSSENEARRGQIN